MKHDVVYLLKNNYKSTDELRYSIRSVVKNFPYRKIVFVYNAAKLIYLRGGEELTFVGNDRVTVGVIILELLENIQILIHDKRFLRKSNSGADNILSVAVVKRGLDKPDLHSALLVIKFSNKRVCGL